MKYVKNIIINKRFYLLTEIFRQPTKSKSLTDYRQSNWILTDNRQVDLPIQTLLWTTENKRQSD